MTQERERGPFAAGAIDRRGRDSAAGDFGRAQAIPEPATFGEAFEAARQDQTQTRNHNVRQFETENELWERHRAIEEALGRELALPHSLTGEPTSERDSLTGFLNRIIPADSINAAILGRPGSVSDDAYEDQIEALRLEHPEALARIETREALQRRLEERWFGIRAEAQATADSGGVGALGSFAGSMVGAFQDPPTAASALLTGGAGASRPLVQRMLIQGAIGAGWEVTEAPDRAHDAAVYGGPAYTAQEGVSDVLMGALGPMAFEAGGSALRIGTRPIRQAFGMHAEPVTRSIIREIDRSSRQHAAQALSAAPEPILRAAARQMDGLDRDEALIGAMDPSAFDDARRALDTGSAPIAPPAVRDLEDLFDTTVSIPGRQVVDYQGRRILRADIEATAPGADLTGALAYEDAGGVLRLLDGQGDAGPARWSQEAAGGGQGAAFVLRAADGWSVEEARLVAALRGLRADGGSSFEAARLLREIGEAIDIESLPVAGRTAEAARGLSRLTDDVFAEAERSGVPANVAAVVGDMAAAFPQHQARALEALATARVADDRVARLMVRELLLADILRSYGLTDLAGPDDLGSIAKQAERTDRALAEVMGDESLLQRVLARSEASDAWGYARPRSSAQVEASIELAAASVIDRLVGRDAADDLVGALRRELDQAEAADQLRRETIAARAPPQAARDAAADFTEFGGIGQQRQLNPKPEEAAAELTPDWDDLRAELDERRATDVLRKCAPGGM